MTRAWGDGGDACTMDAFVHPLKYLNNYLYHLPNFVDLGLNLRESFSEKGGQNGIMMSESNK